MRLLDKIGKWRSAYGSPKVGRQRARDDTYLHRLAFFLHRLHSPRQFPNSKSIRGEFMFTRVKRHMKYATAHRPRSNPTHHVDRQNLVLWLPLPTSIKPDATSRTRATARRHPPSHSRTRRTTADCHLLSAALPSAGRPYPLISQRPNVPRQRASRNTRMASS